MSGWLDLRVGEAVPGELRGRAARVFPAARFADPSAIGWNLVLTAPGAEATASKRLHEGGVTSYYPLRRRVVKVRCGRGRRRWREEIEWVPAFPRYVFVEERAGGIDEARIIAGSAMHGVVMVGGSPVHVRRSVIERTRMQEKDGLFDDASRVHSVYVGALVLITGGPFEGIRGTMRSLPERSGEECRVWIDIGTVNVALDDVEVL